MKTVLLVEDNRILQLASQRVLTRAGYRVLTAEDGEKAVAIAHNDHPDIILLDMMLPKLSGPEVLGCLTRDPSTAHIPIVVLTGLSQKNEARLRKEGAVAFIEKGQCANDPNLLLLTVEKILNEGAARKETFEKFPVEANRPGQAAQRQ